MRWIAATLLALLVGCSASPPASDGGTASTADAGLRRTLAPSGRLRVAMYRGSPSSIVEVPGGEPRGVAYDLGRALANRLGVPFEPVVFAKNEDALAAMKAGSTDMAFTNATAARAGFMDFSPPLMDVAKSFLVPAASTLQSIADTQRAGLRIGVSEGSSTEAELRPNYGQATLVRVPTLKAAGEMLADGRLDAFATNNAILFEVSDGVPGSRILPGRWGMEHFAIGIPKGRDAGRAFVADFARSAIELGLVRQAAQRAGLRGTIEPEPVATR